MTKRIGIITMGIFTLVSLAVTTVIAQADEKKAESDRIAVVNGTVISKSEFEQELNTARLEMMRQGREVSETVMGDLRKGILDKLINQELLFQESVKKGIKPDEKTVSDFLGKVKSRFPNDEAFKKALTSMKLNEKELERRIRRNVSIQELVKKEFSGKVDVSEKETRRFYDNHPELFKKSEQVKASHILVKVDKDADDAAKTAAKKKIEAIQKRIKNGEDFAKVAGEESEGPSKEKGGDLGFFGRGQMVKPFEDAAFSLKPNEVSDIVETRFGYHLIKVFEKKPGQTVAFEMVKDKINKHLKDRKTREQVDTHLNDLKKTAKIEKFL